LVSYHISRRYHNPEDHDLYILYVQGEVVIWKLLWIFVSL